jgi:hypothetical protein
MLTVTTLAGLMTGASFGPPQEPVWALRREWPQKDAAQAGPRLHFRIVVLAPLSPVSVG